MILENSLQWKNKGDDYYTASLKGKRDQIFLSVGKISDQDFSWTVNGNAGILSGSSRSLEQAKATAEREAKKILDSKYYNALETNFKWSPWKRGSDDRDYSPFVIQQYEREGTKDVGEFKDIPASQSRFIVVDGQGGHHEFDSRSDAMKYAEKSFKEWKKMQKTKKNARASEEQYVGKALQIMGLLGDPVTGKTTKTYQLAMKYVQQGMSGVQAIKKAMSETGEKRKDMAQNSLAQKKLAVIKSNAAPAVKLKALEVLSNDNEKEYQNITMSIEKGQYKGFEYEVIGDPWPEPKKYAARSTVVPNKLKKAGKSIYSSWESKPESALQDLKKKIDEYLAAQNSYKNGVLSNEELSPEEIKKRFGEAKQKAKPFPIQELEKAQKEYETAKKDKSIDPEKLKKISDRYQDLLRKYQDSLKNSYKNADSKLDPAKLALSKMLEQFGYKAMARDVMQESDIQALKKYARVVISEFEKAKSPKADRVKALLGQLGIYSASIDNANDKFQWGEYTGNTRHGTYTAKDGSKWAVQIVGSMSYECKPLKIFGERDEAALGRAIEKKLKSGAK